MVKVFLTAGRKTKMKRFLGTSMGKAILFAEDIAGKDGSTFPGKFVTKLFPDYLATLSYPKDVIMVTGSSGKGSTTAIIAELLRHSGKTVCHNLEGSNMLRGIASTMLKHVKNGGIPEDAIVLEVDERYLKVVTKYIHPSLIIVNNVTRDQPPRQGHYDLVAAEIMKGVPEDTMLLVNGDDPITAAFRLKHENTRTFGINRNDSSFTALPTAVKDCVYCPRCGKHFNYSFIHYGSVGGFSCPKCGFARENPDYAVTDVDEEDKEIQIGYELTLPCETMLLFHIYNLCAAYAAADILGIAPEVTAEVLTGHKISSKIYTKLEGKNRSFTSISCKADNNATYNLAHSYTAHQPGKKVLVMGVREISRRYEHFDLSWLYDLDMEILVRPEVEKVLCVGPYADDFILRLKLAGFPEEKLMGAETMDALPAALKGTEGNVYGILNFDVVEPFLEEAEKIIKEDSDNQEIQSAEK